ncbi:MAG: tetratricopeptide repeat protein [Syntrophaceae bacterium]|nr:tetratricopeptide repeat protein [Syntrophaceae bacterium]
MKKKTILYGIVGLLVFGILAPPKMYSKGITEEEKLLRVGIGAYHDGFYDISEKQFSQFIRDYPNHKKVWDVSYLLGKTLMNKRKLREARLVFSRIVHEGKNFEQMDYALFWLATIEMSLGNGEQARRLLHLAIKEFPRFDWIDYSYYLLGLLELGSSRFAEAESSFRKVSLLSKNDQFIRRSVFWLGVLSLKKKEYEAALSCFRGVWGGAETIPKEYAKQALFWLGESYLKLGRFEEARQHYRTFYERFKDDPLVSAVSWRLGFCNYRLGNIKESIEIFQSFRKEFKDSPLMSHAHYLLGEIELIRGDYSSSVKELNPILDGPKANRLAGITALALFWDYIHLGDREGANRVFQRLQKLGSYEEEKIFIQWLNAQVIFSEGRITDSLPYYFTVLDTKFREKALFQIGKGYFLENKFREAMTNLDILLLEFPNSSFSDESLFMKAECLLRLGNLEQALESYDLIAKRSRTSHWQLFALMQASQIYHFRDEHERAETALQRVIRDFPGHPLFYYAAFQLGNAHFRRRNLVEAISFYSMVLKGNGLELLGQAAFALGEIFYQQGKYEKALVSFENAARYLKETSIWFSLTYMEIGNLQKKRGRYEEAKKSYKIVLDQTEDDEIREAVKELLSHTRPN